MANPNRAMAYIANRSPIEEIRCNSLSHAMEVAEAKRAEGFDAKATQRKIGPRAAPIRIFTCFVYEKAKR
jgi:hypothetical protein